MSIPSETANLSVKGHIKITDRKTGEILLDKDNAIHTQNMARILARALANEENSIVHRISFGSGGTFIDVGGNIVYRQPNDGNNGSGWEARLYRETYSEIVDNNSPNLGVDPGSAGSDNTRTGGGQSGAATSANHNVISEEVGKQSNVIVSMVIDENEPSGQLNSQSSPSPTLEESEDTFIFDEIGLYSPGKPGADTSGFAQVDVGNKTSEDVLPLSVVAANTDYAIRLNVDGTVRDGVISTPASGTGTGGAFTYGDVAEGINSGSWFPGGFDFSGSNGAFFFITDQTGGTYPTITGKESYGFFTVQSKTSGVSSQIIVPENSPISGDDNLLYVLASNIWANVTDENDDPSFAGQDAGVINDSVTPADERERLLTHIIFTPILKSAASSIQIEYTLTVSVATSSDSDSTVSVDNQTI